MTGHKGISIRCHESRYNRDMQMERRKRPQGAGQINRAAHKLIQAFNWLLLLPLLYACGGGPSPADREGNPAETAAVDEAVPLKGLKLYLGYCFVCHGQKGDGNGPYAEMLADSPADFTDSTYFKAKTDSELYDFISKGGIAHGKSLHMKPFGFQMTRDEIKSAIAYIRVLNRHEQISRREGSDFSGSEIYKNSCVMCHGEKGAGDGRVMQMLNLEVRPITGRVLSQYSGAELYNIIQDGIPSDTAGAGKYMPAWGASLSEQEIIDVISYIMTFGE